MPDHVPASRPVHPWVAEGHRQIRFGISVYPQPDWPVFLELVQRFDNLGFDGYWKEDHSARGNADCWLTLATLAVTTQRLRLGSFISAIYHRPPALLARMAADVDRLSNGRLVLGLGIGNENGGFTQLGLPFPRMRERQQALDDTVRIVTGLWGDRPFSYQGRHFAVQDARVNPGPVQQPYVPLLIAGGGERGTLRQVAQYADMANIGPGPSTGGVYSVEDVERRLSVLRRHCETLARPYAAILRSYISLPLILAGTRTALEEKVNALPAPWPAYVRGGRGGIVGTPQDVVAHYRALAAVGIQYFIACLRPSDPETLDLLTQEVMPAVAAL